MDYPLFLVGVVVAFVLFGTALAYVDRITARRSDAHSAE